jgi:hypothetical protein
VPQIRSPEPGVTRRPRSLLLALCLGVAAPILAQTPPPETIAFDGLGTPLAYVPGEKVPAAARLKKVTLAGGGRVEFSTRGGAKYAALVTHLGRTAIVGVSKKGKLQPGRFLDARIRKSPGARFDSFTPLQAGVRVDNNDTPTDTTDDETFYDNPGAASFILRASDDSAYPIGGGAFSVLRAAEDAYDLDETIPYDLTTTSLDFVRIQIVGDMVYDDLVVSFGHEN